MKKVLFFGLLAVALGFSTLANAAIYDDFNNGNLNDGKWTSYGTTGLFSEHDGRLYFTGSAPNVEQRLVSTATFTGETRFGMSFYNFTSTNTSPSGLRQGGAAALSLGPANNFVELVRSHTIDGNYFVFSHSVGGVIQTQETWALPTDVTSGWLGLRYNGTSVFAAYGHEVDAGATGDWHPLGGAINPGWTGPIRFVVAGGTGTSGATSFQIDNVGYSSVPVPPSLLLLAPGLAGLIAVRRRFKK